MRRLFVLTILAGLLLNANAFAADAKEEPSSEEQAKIAEARGEVCHMEALTPGHKTLKLPPPCAPKNYIYLGMPEVTQKEIKHDKNGIWTDDELGQESESWIWEKTVIEGDTEIFMSLPIGAICSTRHGCPIRVRIKQKGKPPIIKMAGELGGEQPCATVEDLFIRNDFKEFLACGEKFPLK